MTLTPEEKKKIEEEEKLRQKVRTREGMKSWLKWTIILAIAGIVLAILMFTLCMPRF